MFALLNVVNAPLNFCCICASLNLIGGGGASPATLSNGAGTAGTVQLVGGADWVALSDATIDLQVFDDGTTLFFREVARR